MSKELETEISQIKSKIQKELDQALADPEVQRYFKNRVRMEKAERELQKLESERISVEAQYHTLVNDLAVNISPGLMEDLNKFSVQFKTQGERTVLSDLGDHIERQWNKTQNEFQKELSKLSSLKDTKASALPSADDIMNTLNSLSVKYDEDMQEMLMSYVKGKVEKDLKNKESELRKLIDEPVKVVSQAVTEQARKVDVAESIAINSMYKMANFLNKGKFEISFWQKFSIFAKNFDITDLRNTFQTEKRWETLCLKIKSAVDKGDMKAIENIPKEVDQFFASEQKKVENALTAMEEAIENVMNAENGEEVARKLLENAANEVEKYVKKEYGVTPLQTAKRVDALAGHFDKIKGTIESMMPKEKKEEEKNTQPESRPKGKK